MGGYQLDGRIGWLICGSCSERRKFRHAALLVVDVQKAIDAASTMQVVNALIKAHKDFDLLVVPNGSHGVFRSTGDVSYGLRRQYDFFVRHLRQEPTPDWNALL